MLKKWLPHAIFSLLGWKWLLIHNIYFELISNYVELRRTWRVVFSFVHLLYKCRIEPVLNFQCSVALRCCKCFPISNARNKMSWICGEEASVNHKSRLNNWPTIKGNIDGTCEWNCCHFIVDTLLISKSFKWWWSQTLLLLNTINRLDFSVFPWVYITLETQTRGSALQICNVTNILKVRKAINCKHIEKV